MSTPHPGIDEFDTGSWLDGSLSEHDVLGTVLAPDGSILGYRLDGAPSTRTDGLNSLVVAPADRKTYTGPEDAPFATYCQQHAFERAAAVGGYCGPIEVAVSYQDWSPLETEQVMVLRDDSGSVVSVACYSYGRAYFEPGEPRADPCAVCGAETLIPASGYAAA